MVCSVPESSEEEMFDHPQYGRVRMPAGAIMGYRYVWDTQTALQAVGTGVLVMYGLRAQPMRPDGEYFWVRWCGLYGGNWLLEIWSGAWLRAQQSARIGFGAL